MTSRRQLLLLASMLLVAMMMIGPATGTIGVFITPLIKQFGWTHAQVSRIATAYALGLGINSFLSGRLLERINARWLMAAGCSLVGFSFLAASRVQALTPLLICYFLIGTGSAFSTIVPMAVVAANWFPTRRSFALGVAYFGVGTGVGIAPRLITGVVLSWGWRAGMIAVGLPMILLATPICLLFIRTRPDSAQVEEQRHEERPAYGLELATALWTAPFWLLAIVSVGRAMGSGCVQVHTIPYLIDAGFSAATASVIFGSQAIMSAPGSLLLGAMADRFGPKWVLMGSVFFLAVGIISLLSIGQHWLGGLGVASYIVFYGIDMATGPVAPMLYAETLGMRRFSTFAGINSALATVGTAIGPVLSGKLFDITGRYVVPFELGALILVGSSLLISLIFPAKGHDAIPEQEQAEVAASAAR